MNDYEKLCDFHKLYIAHTKARRGKRHKAEVIRFEMNLAENLCDMQEALQNRSYTLNGYYAFKVFDPKERVIHALHYPDRVFQHCLCDEVLGPLIDQQLIYDNAACRRDKGNHFAMRRLSQFMIQHYRQFGCQGYFLKCDIRKYFNNIDHDVLKRRLDRVIADDDIRRLLYGIIDSYHSAPGKGLPLGNQSSQWLALYYLDGLDRLVKEKFRIKHYSRYMDDMVLLHPDKARIKECLRAMQDYLKNELKLEFNEKTQVCPIKNGVDYLGFHFYLSSSGKVIRKLKSSSRMRCRRRMLRLSHEYAEGRIDLHVVRQSLAGVQGHLIHGHTYLWRERQMQTFQLQRADMPEESVARQEK